MQRIKKAFNMLQAKLNANKKCLQKSLIINKQTNE